MAKDLNRVTAIGNVVRDPEMRYMPDGTATCKITIACNDDYKDKNTGEKKEVAEFIPFTVFGKLAEICGQYLTKGKKIYAEGKFTTRKWTDKDGVDRYTTEVKMENMQMLGGRGEGGGSSGGNEGGGYRGQPGHQPAPTRSNRPAPNYSDMDDDIPF